MINETEVVPQDQEITESEVEETPVKTKSKEDEPPEDKSKQKRDNGFNPALERIKRERDAERKQRIDLEAKLENERRSKLKEKEDWKTYSQELEEQNKSLSEKNEKTLKAVIFEKKITAAKEAALAAGMRADALKHIERYGVDELEIETTSTGRINVLGAESFVAKLKQESPYLFGSKGARINSDTPDVGKAKSVSYEELQKLKTKHAKSGSPDDWSAYEKAYHEYVKSL